MPWSMRRLLFHFVLSCCLCFDSDCPMKSLPTTRCLVRRIYATTALGLLALLPVAACAYPQPGPQNRPPAPVPHTMPPPSAPHRIGPAPNMTGQPQGAHLGQWIQQHGNLNPQQQQRALESEPGFRQLPQGTQRQMLDRLNRLNSMPEPQRNRVIQRNEFMERMSPQQRGDVRNAMGQLSTLPVDRRRAVARSFRELRNMPPEQRNAILNSPQYRQQFSDQERGTLGNLLAVGPLLPPSP